MKIVWVVISCIAFAYIGLLFFAYFFSEKIIFPAPQSSYTKAENGIYFVDVNCNGRIYKMASLWLFSDKSDLVLLYSHGNGEDLGEIRPTLEALHSQGISVFAYDYIGYGLSGGKSSIENFEACADAAWNELVKNKGINPSKISLMGYSLGSAATSHLVSQHGETIRAFILAGAFSEGVCAILPINILPWKILDNVSKIKDCKKPLMLIHGTRDFTVPFRNFETISDSYSGKLTPIVLKGEGHGSIFKTPNFIENIVKFIKEQDL